MPRQQLCGFWTTKQFANEEPLPAGETTDGALGISFTVGEAPSGDSP